ncbi:MAG: helix-turn-helix transcriptional regulator [Candidatus Cloacimonetes bacterium]|nr:helix-turn-helix transcriptional regulator [Candidatus Cloacimonadota bacterium]
MGERIKQLRIEKGMTQEELGQVIGVQKSAIRKYEKGEVENIKRSSIKKLADLFDVSPTFIMGWEEEYDELALAKEVKLIEQIQEQYGKDAVELLNQFNKLNALGRNKAVDIIADLTEIQKYFN